MPSRWAADAPSTTAGYRPVRPFSQTPLRMVAPTVDGNVIRAAKTDSPLVTSTGIRSDRYTFTLGIMPTAEVAVTGPIRPIIASASWGLIGIVWYCDAIVRLAIELGAAPGGA